MRYVIRSQKYILYANNCCRKIITTKFLLSKMSSVCHAFENEYNRIFRHEFAEIFAKRYTHSGGDICTAGASDAVCKAPLEKFRGLKGQ